MRVAADFLPVRAVNEIADGPEQQVGHADHQVNALVISAGLPHRFVLFLRTGGGDGFLSGRACPGGARQGKSHEDRQNRDK